MSERPSAAKSARAAPVVTVNGALRGPIDSVALVLAPGLASLITLTVTACPEFTAPDAELKGPAPMRYSPPVMLTAADPPSPVMVTEADSIHVLRGMRKRGANARLSGVVSPLPVATAMFVEKFPIVRIAALVVFVELALIFPVTVSPFPTVPEAAVYAPPLTL